MRAAFCGAVRAKRHRATTERDPPCPSAPAIPSAAPRRSSTAPGATLRWPCRSASASRSPLVNALYRLAEADRSAAPAHLHRPHAGASAPIAPAWSGASSSRCSTACSAATPISTTPGRCARGGLPPNIEVTEFFLQAGAWLSNARVQRSYTSLNYSQVAEHLERIGTNVFGQLVAPHPQGEPRISLSSNTDVTLDMRPYIAARRQAGQPLALAVEINANLPYMPGAAEMDASECDVVLETERPHYDLFAPPKEPVSLPDYAMALHAATLIKDGGTLQIGIGSFSDALAHALILRHTRNGDFRALLDQLGAPLPADAELAPFTIGLYGCTEMLVDGFLALMRAGILRRRVDRRRRPRGDPACRLLRRQPGLLSRAAGDAAPRRSS